MSVRQQKTLPDIVYINEDTKEAADDSFYNQLSDEELNKALDAYDDEVPFDVKGDDLSIQQLDDFFGITNEERENKRSARGDTQEAFTGYSR